jgi:hypothetical protein
MKRTAFNKSKSIIVDMDGYVGAQLVGGLGNQLFIIATAYAYSIKYNKAFHISKTWPGISDSRPSYWTTLLKNVPGVKDLTGCIDYKEKDFSYNPIPKYKGNIRLKGYYQSPKYFNEYEDRIRQLFQLPEDIDIFASEYIKKFEGNTKVAVHIRRGDYLKLSKTHYIQDINYYKIAKKVIEQKLGFRPSYLYFSDDKEWVRDNFTLEVEDIIIEDLSKDYQEFAVMQKCNHFIIANSSFSWWSAWLSSTNSEKIVIAPFQWFGLKGPSNWQDIYLENWITLKDFKDNLFEGIQDDNRLNIIHKFWVDDIIINDDMTFKRHLYPDEKGRLFINDETIKCVWDNYGVESLDQNIISVKGNIAHLENKQRQYINNSITPILYDKVYNLYLINLEHRTDKKDTFMKDIDSQPFNIHHFKAIANTKGWRGCSLSHLSLVKYAKDNKMPYIVVAEDDALIKVSPEEVADLMSSLANNLDKWEIFNGAPSIWDKRDKIEELVAIQNEFNDKLINLNWGQSTSFMAYNSNVYDKLLAYNFEMEIDQFNAKSFIQTIYRNTPFSIQKAFKSDVSGVIQSKDYESFFFKQYEVISKLNNGQFPITFVSCFYNIKSKHNANIYKDWASKLLNSKLNCNFVIYTNEESKSYIEEFTRDKDNIKLVIKPLKSFAYYQFKDLWIENQTRNTTLSQVSWELVMLWCEKIEFIKDAMENKYFESEWLGWCDIGYFRKGGVDKWPNTAKITKLDKSKIYYNQLKPDSKINKYRKTGRNQWGLLNKAIDPLHDTISGGFFMIHPTMVSEYGKVFMDRIKLYFEHKYLIKDDQVIILDCILSHSHMFNLIKGKLNWFLFREYLL